jgi:hypothetical protein
VTVGTLQTAIGHHLTAHKKKADGPFACTPDFLYLSKEAVTAAPDFAALVFFTKS